MTMNNKARIRISGELIIAALCMPEGTILDHIERERMYLSDDYIFYVSHPDLNEVPEGGKIPIISPIYTINEGAKPAKYIVWDWNQ